MAMNIPMGPSTAVSAAPVGAPRKKKKSFWDLVLGAPEALLQDTQDFIHGIIPGGKLVLGSLLHDINNVAHGAPDDFQSDDLVDAIWEDYKDRYGPAWESLKSDPLQSIASLTPATLIPGVTPDGVNESRRKVLEHPLGPILDVLTLVSGGASAYGKAGQVIAKSGKLSEKTRIAGAKMSGLAKTDSADPMRFVPRVFSDEGKLVPDPLYAQNPWKDWGTDALPGSLTPDELEARVLALSGKRGVKIGEDVYLPEVREYLPMGPDGKHFNTSPQPFAVEMKRSPYQRRKQEAIAEFGVKHPTAPGIGMANRIARRDARFANQPATAALPAMRALGEAAKELKDEPALRAQITNFLGTQLPDDQLAFYQKQLGLLGTHEKDGATRGGLSNTQKRKLNKRRREINKILGLEGEDLPGGYTSAGHEYLKMAKQFDELKKQEAELSSKLAADMSAIRQGAEVPDGYIRTSKKELAALRARITKMRPQVGEFRPHRKAKSPVSKAATKRLEAELAGIQSRLDMQPDSDLKYMGMTAHVANIDTPLRHALGRALRGDGIEPGFEQVLSEKNIAAFNKARQAIIDAHREQIQPGIEGRWRQRGADGKTPEGAGQSQAAAAQMRYSGADDAEDTLSLLQAYAEGHGAKFAEGQGPLNVTQQGWAQPVRDARNATRQAKKKDVAFEKGNTLYNAENGLQDIDSLGSVYRTVLQGVAADVTVRRTAAMFSQVTRWPATMTLPKGYVSATMGKQAEVMRARAQNMLRFLDEDVTLGFGDDAPDYLLDGMQASLESFLRDLPEDTQLIVPNSVMKTLFPEIEKSDNFIRKFYDKQSTFWRNYTLGLRPAWMVNNVLGNIMLLVAEYGVWGSLRSIMSYTTDPDVRKAILENAPDLVHGSQSREWANEALMTEAKNSIDVDFGKRILKDADPKESIGAIGTRFDLLKRLASGPGRLGEKAIEFNAKNIDDPFRRLAGWARVRPAVHELQSRLKAMGKPVSREEAIKMLLDDDAVKDDVISRVAGDMVNVKQMTPYERDVLRRIFPFYAWMSGITRRSAALAGDKPWQTAIVLKAGELGYEDAVEKGREDFLSAYLEVPEFLHRWLGIPKGTKPLLSTAGPNVFATTADVLGMASALLPGGEGVEGLKGTTTPMSAINPLLKTGVEVATKKDMFYQRPLREIQQDEKNEVSLPLGPDPDPKMNAAVLALSRYASAFPQYGFAQDMKDPGDGDQSLFAPSRAANAANYMGVPIRYWNEAESERRRKERLRRELQLERMKQLYG